MDSAGDTPRLTPAKGLIILFFVVLGVAAYIAAGTALGIAPLYAGFAFSLYFGGIKHSEPREFAPALVGSLGGLATAAALHILPEHFGSVGMGVALLVILAAIYALLMGWVTTLVNYGYMLMLTIATIPAVKEEAAFLAMACSILLAAALMGALLLAGMMAARRGRTPATA
jgi:hypothetical protein